MTATRTKRILSVQPVGDGGGSEHALIRMIRQLAEDGWECHVAVPAPARLADEYAAAGATLHIVPMARLTTSGGAGRWLGYAARWPLSVLRLAWLARRIGAGVIHSNSLHTWYGWAAAAAGPPPPRVARPGDRVPVRPGPAGRALAGPALRGWWSSPCRGRSPPSSTPRNVTVIIDEADPDGSGRTGRPVPAGRRHRRRAPRWSDRSARIDTWKGFDVLLDAFPAIRAARPDVGAGRRRRAGRRQGGLRRRPGQPGPRPSPGVHWLGPAPDVADLMADLDVFVQVSTEPEPFGLVVVEALASGVPVVAGAAGGPLEILGRGGPRPGGPAGRLVAPGDAAPWPTPCVDLLPAGPSSTTAAGPAGRCASPAPAEFAALFDRVLRPARGAGAATGAERAGGAQVAVGRDQGVRRRLARRRRPPGPGRPRPAGPAAPGR